MILNKSLIRIAVILSIAFAAVSAFAQNAATTDAKRVMWEQVNIAERDLYYGPGGKEMVPVLEKAQFLGRQTGGTNLKYRLKDGAGREWVVKVADEAQPETAAVRLLWGIGYKTEINYLVPKLEIQKVGNYKNVRFEARPDGVKRLDRWSWASNPFNGTKELEGLKIMMALLNNWDVKDENTVILQTGNEHHYVVADLGATFGRLPDADGSRSGRTVNKPEDYSQSKIIKQVRDGVVEIDYPARPQTILKSFKVEDGRWLADLLLQLSDKQIEDAFRAANYKPEDVKLLAQAFKTRIKELDEATKTAASTTTAAN